MSNEHKRLEEIRGRLETNPPIDYATQKEEYRFLLTVIDRLCDALMQIVIVTKAVDISKIAFDALHPEINEPLFRTDGLKSVPLDTAKA